MRHPVLARAMLGGRQRRPVIDLTALLGDEAAPAIEMAGDWKPFKTRSNTVGAVNSAGDKLYGEDAERVLRGSQKKPGFVQNDLKQHKNETEARKAKGPNPRKRSKFGRMVAVGLHKGKKRLAALARGAQRGVEGAYHGAREWVAGRLENLGVQRTTGRAAVDVVAGLASTAMSWIGFNSGGPIISRATRQAVADRTREQQEKNREDTDSPEAHDARHEAMGKDKAVGWAFMVDMAWMAATVATGAIGFGWVGALVGGFLGFNVPLGSTLLLAGQAAAAPIRTLGSAWKAFWAYGEASEFRPGEVEDVQKKDKQKKYARKRNELVNMATEDADEGDPAANQNDATGFTREQAAGLMVSRSRKGWDMDWWTSLLMVALDNSDTDLKKAVALADRIYKKRSRPVPVGEDEALDLLDEQFSGRLGDLIGDDKAGKEKGEKKDKKAAGEEAADPFA